MRLGRRASAWGAAGVIALAAAAACFSDRSATGPASGTCRLPVSEGVPGSVVVPIANFAFQPAEVRIHAGQTVTWVNCEDDATAHTTHANDEAWSSPLLSPGNAFSHTFDQPGTFDYHCDPHPFMTGRVVVE
ncbi:MAG TPA: cupredoxin family copper-binding protein [Gemmatimonadales bacterium]|nr:cupredoxin family copper-binding protein [Gemmatimonadales bacterium]